MKTSFISFLHNAGSNFKREFIRVAASCQVTGAIPTPIINLFGVAADRNFQTCVLFFRLHSMIYLGFLGDVIILSIEDDNVLLFILLCFHTCNFESWVLISRLYIMPKLFSGNFFFTKYSFPGWRLIDFYLWIIGPAWMDHRFFIVGHYTLKYAVRNGTFFFRERKKLWFRISFLCSAKNWSTNHLQKQCVEKGHHVWILIIIEDIKNGSEC